MTYLEFTRKYPDANPSKYITKHYNTQPVAGGNGLGNAGFVSDGAGGYVGLNRDAMTAIGKQSDINTYNTAPTDNTLSSYDSALMSGTDFSTNTGTYDFLKDSGFNTQAKAYGTATGLGDSSQWIDGMSNTDTVNMGLGATSTILGGIQDYKNYDLQKDAMGESKRLNQINTVMAMDELYGKKEDGTYHDRTKNDRVASSLAGGFGADSKYA